MALPVWPATLPPLVSLLQAGGSPGLIPAWLSTAMDDGPPRQRRRFLYRTTKFNMTLMLTHAQVAAFMTFLTTTLNHGTLRFTASVRLPNATLGTRECWFEAPPSVDDLATRRTVSFTLVIKDW
jgi:hypothetical protein